MHSWAYIDRLSEACRTPCNLLSWSYIEKPRRGVSLLGAKLQVRLPNDCFGCEKSNLADHDEFPGSAKEIAVTE